MIYDDLTLALHGEMMRQEAVKYLKGKKQVLSWREQYWKLEEELRLDLDKKTKKYKRLYKNKITLLKKIDEYLQAEEFFFDDDNPEGIEFYFEKYKLYYVWSSDYIKRMVREGWADIFKKRKVTRNVNNEGTDDKNGEGLLGDQGGEGHFRTGSTVGCDEGGASGISFGDSAEIGREATLLAGCVC